MFHGDVASDIGMGRPISVAKSTCSPYDRKMPQRSMHQTTVRFGADLWEALEREAERLSVSVAQYVREAALARLIYASGKRGDEEFDLALEIALGGTAEPARTPQPEGGLRPAARAVSPIERSKIEISDSAALWGQAAQARRRAQELREESAGRVRKRHSLHRP
jgi:hypothetical protein